MYQDFVYEILSRPHVGRGVNVGVVMGAGGPTGGEMDMPAGAGGPEYASSPAEFSGGWPAPAGYAPPLPEYGPPLGEVYSMPHPGEQFPDPFQAQDPFAQDAGGPSLDALLFGP